MQRILFIITFLFCLTFNNPAQYRFDSWTTKVGLPQNSVRTIVRTNDGYLWMGTFEGLARFDGVDFTVFDMINTPELKSNGSGSIKRESYFIVVAMQK